METSRERYLGSLHMRKSFSNIRKKKFIHLCIHPFILQIIIEDLLYARNHLKPRGGGRIREVLVKGTKFQLGKMRKS